MPFNRLLRLCIVLLLSACASAPVSPPTASDCLTIRLWSNGWHANLAMPADALNEDHPLRALFPEADYFLIGWGERDFYMAMNAGFWKALKAIIPPSPSVMQVIAADEPVENALWPGSDLVEVAISRAGAERLAEGLARSLAYDDAGVPIILDDGRVTGASYFLAARPNFHLFNMCNHWAAKRLQEAGLPVTARISFTAPGLLNAVRRKTPPSCPAEE